MEKKNTQELEKILNSTHPGEFSVFLEENQGSLMENDREFDFYVKDLIHRKNLTQQKVFVLAQIPEGYGYKLLRGEKTTKQRDVILRICYAAEFTAEETQRALKLYGLPLLYAKVPRDAFLLACFHNRPGTIPELNALLEENGLLKLRTTGHPKLEKK